MADRSEAVHVHKSDVESTMESYRQKGYVLQETTDPTIIAQVGFVKLIFVPVEDFVPEPEPPRRSKKLFGLFFS